MVVHRAEALRIKYVYQDRSDKSDALDDLSNKLAISHDQIAYVGDDLPDVPLLKRVGFSACPSDAHLSVATIDVWQSKFAGGCGAVRKFADLFLEARERFNAQ